MDEYGRKEEVRDAIGCLFLAPLAYAVLVLALCL
jgi:hypothetical protein